MTDLSSPPPKSKNIRILSALWPYLRGQKRLILFTVIALVVAASLVLGLGQAVRVVVDRGLGNQGDADLLNQALIVMLGLIVLLAGATYVRFLCVTLLGERLVADLRRDVFAHVLRLSPPFFETTKTGELISRITADTTVLQTTVGSSLSVAARHAIMLVGGLILLISTSAQLALMVALLAPLVVVPIIIFGKKVRRLSRLSQDKVADVGALMDESLHGIRTVQAFTREPMIAAHFNQSVEGAFRAARERVKARALMTALVIMLAFGAVVLILWVGGHAKLEGDISGGELSAFIFYAVVVAGALAAISEILGDLQRAAGATERLLELLDTKPEIVDQPALLSAATATAAAAAPVMPQRPALTLDGVRFAYRSRPDQPALEDLSLDVQPGETVAVVGPSGAGKSTLFQLLLRFHAPDAGTITLGGRSLSDWPLKTLRDSLAVVPQEPTIFSFSVGDNIAFGRPDATQAEIEAAADAAQCTEFIKALPQGFETLVGERGLTLSGGQRQRVALARAILRDPKLLLLDEATSALDAESERLVQEALDRVRAGRTTLVIAHRLATVRAADRIVVLDQGRMIAQGTHSELVAQGGLYARLAALQFRDAA